MGGGAGSPTDSTSDGIDVLETAAVLRFWIM